MVPIDFPTPREVYSIQRLQQLPYETGHDILPTVQAIAPLAPKVIAQAKRPRRGIVPSLNDPFLFKQFQMFSQLIAQGFIFMGVGEKDFHRVWESWRNGYLLERA
jgi:hypothetical protein